MKKNIKNFIIILLLITFINTIPAYAATKKNTNSKSRQAKKTISASVSKTKNNTKKKAKSTKTPVNTKNKSNVKSQSKATSKPKASSNSNVKSNGNQGHYVYVTYKKNGKTYRKKVWQPSKTSTITSKEENNIKPNPVPSKLDNDKKSDNNTDLKKAYEVNSIKYYDVEDKELIAIPVDCKVNSNDSNISYDIKYDCIKNNNKTNIIIENATTELNYHESFTSLKKDVSLMAGDNNTINIEIDTSDDINVDVNTINSKNYTSNGVKYARKYIVVGISKKSNTDGNSSDNPDENNTSDNNINGDSSLTSRGDDLQQNSFSNKSQILITLDAGHGGSASGAVSGSIMEKDLNLDITLRLKKLLEEEGYRVYLTRSSDSYLSLQDRADAANIVGSNLFLSIHHNSILNSSYNGTTVLYNSKALKPAYTLASCIKNEVCDKLNTYPLNIQNRPEIAVLNSTYMPAVLLEVCCISNSQDLEKILVEDNRNIAAFAVLKGINKYFKFE